MASTFMEFERIKIKHYFCGKSQMTSSFMTEHKSAAMTTPAVNSRVILILFTGFLKSTWSDARWRIFWV